MQEKRIYIDVSTAQLSALGLTPEQMTQTLQSQNLVVDAGRVDYLNQRLRVAPTGEFQSPEEIGDLAIAGATGGRDEIIRIRDFATVSFGYVDPPGQLLRQNGRQAIALALAPGAGENVVQVGQAVASTSSFIGKGPPRFYLPVSAEDPYTSYAQIIVNTKTLSAVDQLVAHADAWVRENAPEAMVRVRKYAVGAFDDWKIEARFSGPANADPATLRRLAEEGANILRDCPYAKEVRSNWRERVQALVPRYNQERGRWARVSRDDLARTTRRASDGVTVGQYRQGDDLIPIVARNVEQERLRAATSLEELQITPRLSTHAIPVSQVVDGIGTPWEDPIIWRWDRRRAITVQCSPNGVTAPTLRNAVVSKFQDIKLPPGYRLDWDGEYWSAKQSQDALTPGIVPAVVVMLFILVALFNGFRPMLICVLVIPFVMIGIAAGLLMTGTPFGFIALLGAMSLSGMMIKNVVVLLDEVNANLSKGLDPYHALIEAAVTRLSPVVNAAGTTVLGVLPMLQDVFWVALAVTIFFGLIVGTMLTMVVGPTLYALLYRIPPR